MADDPKAIALAFHDAINRRDLEALVALMSEDHVFIDSADRRTAGRERMRAAWAGFFESFPDYRNEVGSVTSRDGMVVMLGRSVCSEAALDGPAIWTAVIDGDRVAEWRVRDDDERSRRELGL